MTKGRRIRLKREELNISQTDLSKLVGISKQTLYKYENDIVTNIPSSNIQKIADALGVTPAYIMGWETPDYTVQPGDILIEVDKAKELYSQYESLPPEKQAAFLNYLKFLQSDT